MSRIAILSLSISPGDAVGNDALEMHRILSARGHTVGLFSSHWIKKSEQSRDVAELPTFLGDDPQAILIYHHAIGWTAGLDLLRRATCRRVVKYHNVTPGRFFSGFPGDQRRVCQIGASSCATWRGPNAICTFPTRLSIRANCSTPAPPPSAAS
jgi:hypothetical protein